MKKNGAVEMELTAAELATNQKTLKHIRTVQDILTLVCIQLTTRGREHDRSKLERPEVAVFTKYTSGLAALTYDSDEYRQCLAAMKPALNHHYANNRHHPQFFQDPPARTQVSFMNLIDLVEMVCDWKAASLRHNDGDFRKSVKANAMRFNLAPQLVEILLNTAEIFDPIGAVE